MVKKKRKRRQLLANNNNNPLYKHIVGKLDKSRIRGNIFKTLSHTAHQLVSSMSDFESDVGN